MVVGLGLVVGGCVGLKPVKSLVRRRHAAMLDSRAFAQVLAPRPLMETNPIRRTIDDLMQRSMALRGYL
jgi:hypothetical protein